MDADGVDLTNKMQFIHPDDDNTDDRTVFQVTLPKPVPPGATVEFSLTFHDILPGSGGAHGLQTRLRHGRPVVPEGRACGGRTRGTATSFMPARNFSRTSARST